MTSGEFHTVLIDQITVPPDRARKDMGDMDEFAQSISQRGFLINPITITRDNVLRAGERRLRACKLLGWTHITCHYIDELDEFELKELELEENIKRRP
jgi:ParB family chromosome partitioning protein